MSLLALMKRQAAILALVLWGAGVPAGAVTVEGLYTVQVPVESSAPNDLREGYREGLKKVLARVSGDAGLLAQESARDLLADAESLVQSYQFLRRSGEEQSNQLQITFGAVGVNRALASIDAPVWGANRPLTLAWIAVEERGGRELVVQAGGDNTTGAWRQIFSDAAESRGLPLALPPPERAENPTLLSEVWGQFMDRVRAASSDLDHNLLAVVKLSRGGNGWQGAWRLEGEGIENSEQSVTGGSPEEVALSVIDTWADMLAARYAVAAGEVGESARVDIIVEQVDSLQDYADVMAGLNRMTPVVAVDPVRVTADRVILKVSFTGEVSQVEQYISLDTRFVPLQAEPLGQNERSSEQAASTEEASGEGAPGDSGPAPGEASETAAANTGGPGEDTESLFRYRPLASDQEDEVQAFEALYQTLRYQWQSAPVAQPEDTSQ